MLLFQHIHEIFDLSCHTADFVIFAQGCNIGWLAPALPLLLSDATPLVDGALTSDMTGWIGSFLALGAIFGTLFFGFLSNFIGYKKSILLCSIPITVINREIAIEKHSLNIQMFHV